MAKNSEKLFVITQYYLQKFRLNDIKSEKFSKIAKVFFLTLAIFTVESTKQ
jgi:hypothetical protein